jgi:hypothetical protein
MQAYVRRGLHPTKERGADGGRPVYFYLFPNDDEAAEAFLMAFGQADTLAAAATGSPEAVSAAMKVHGYYEGFHVAPGGLVGGKKSPPFIEEQDAATALAKNIADYAKALRSHVAVIKGAGGVADPAATGGAFGVGILALIIGIGGAVAAWQHYA